MNKANELCYNLYYLSLPLTPNEEQSVYVVTMQFAS